MAASLLTGMTTAQLKVIDTETANIYLLPAAQVEQAIVVTGEALIGAKRMLKRFMAKHGESFKTWWVNMPPPTREKFLRETCPTLVHSLEDRYCLSRTDVIGPSPTSRLYEGRYDRHLLLLPSFTVAHMAAGDNLTDLYTQMTRNNGNLSMACELGLKMRELFRNKSWPFSNVDEVIRAGRESQVKKGDMLVQLAPLAFRQDSAGEFTSIDADDSLGHNYTHIVDVDAFIGPSGSEFAAYSEGVYLHPFEFEMARQVMCIMQRLLAAGADEYKREVLQVKLSSPMNPTQAASLAMTCTRCRRDHRPPSVILSRCSQCNAVFYCGASCQRDDWLSHKKFCKLFKLPAALTRREAPVDSKEPVKLPPSQPKNLAMPST